jgi:hypothetical protein
LARTWRVELSSHNGKNKKIKKKNLSIAGEALYKIDFVRLSYGVINLQITTKFTAVFARRRFEF